MTKNNTTKKALGSSIFALFMCVMMLIGTTFAWFTDTASTAVNKIQAGTLKVDIVKASDNSSIKGKSMSFVNKDGSADILWEPGVTFKTDGFKIKNDGNLALKYKLQLNGINGSSKLLEVIEFSVVNESGTAVDLDTFEGNLQPAATTSDGSEYSGTYYIQGHMKESAGNEYQGLDLEGIGITVVATQLASEFDSTTDQYDASAEYPVVASAKVSVGSDEKTTGDVTIASKKKVDETTTPVVEATVPSGAKMETGKTELVLKVTESTTPANVKVTSDQKAETLEVKMEGLSTDNTELIKVSLYVGKDLSGFELYHNTSKMTSKNSASSLGDQEYYYNSETGIVTFATKTFSPFTCVYDAVATVSTQDELVKALADGNVKTIKLISDINLTEVLSVVHSVTIDFCGHKISASGNEVNEAQYAIEILNTATSSNKLVFKDSIGGGELESTYGDVWLCSSRAQFELNDVTVSCEKGNAINVYGPNYVLSDDLSTAEYGGIAEGTSIVMNSGKIVVPKGDSSANGAIHSGLMDCDKKHEVIINGGTIEAGKSYSAFYMAAGSKLTINAGTFISTKGEEIIFVADESVETTINGGTFEVKEANKAVASMIINKGSGALDAKVTVTGGSFTVNGTAVDVK